jgi:hypothetical protein
VSSTAHGHKTDGSRRRTHLYGLSPILNAVYDVAPGDAPAHPPCLRPASVIHLSSGDLTSLAAGTGLTGGGDNGDVSMSIAPSYRLPQSCSTGQAASWNGTAWACAGFASRRAWTNQLPRRELHPQRCALFECRLLSGNDLDARQQRIRRLPLLDHDRRRRARPDQLSRLYERRPQGRPLFEHHMLCGDDLNLDTAGIVGEYTSITTGADGLGLITYSDRTDSALKVAHCANTACSTATSSTLDAGLACIPRLPSEPTG